MSPTISIVVNGQARELPASSTIATLIVELGLEAGRVAVERNREIARRADWERTALEPGDQLEVVEFVGGG